MAHSKPRNLKELLNEDQEPFHLSDYIADKRSKLIPHQRKQLLRLIKQQRQPLQPQKRAKQSFSRNASFPAKFCRNACSFSSSFSAVDSPDHLRQSPLLLSPHKSPIKASSSHALFLYVPAKTAALLLEAALRIQKSSSNGPSLSNPRFKNSGFGLLGSVIRRITHRNRTRKLESWGSETEDVVRWADSVKLGDGSRESDASRRDETTRNSGESAVVLEEKSYIVEDQTGRLRSFWSEDTKSMDLGSSFSSSSSSFGNSRSSHSRDDSDDEENRFVSTLGGEMGNNGDDDAEDFTFCLSPFQFALYRSPSPDHLSTSGFSSPAKSPSRFECEGNERDSSITFLEKEEGEVGLEEDDKEQNSPVSVLDLPFEDDEQEECHAKDDKEFNLECSYELVQRAKHNLLQKLRKFEKLAELKPVELDYEELEYTSQDEIEDDDSTSNKLDKVERFIADMSTVSGFQQLLKPGVKMLISDLISEEERAAACHDHESVVKRVCKRLESWEEIEPNTIDMMAGLDLKRENRNSEWKMAEEEISSSAREIEILIFSVLVDELFDELMFGA